MPLKIILLVVSLLSIYQVWHKSTLISIFAKKIVKVGDYQAFSNDATTLVLWAGLLFLFSCFLFIKKTDEKPSAPSSYHWLGSFLVVIGICVGFVLAVNPDGRFPWNERSVYATIAARSIKPNLYEKLSSTPDVIIFGSSVSFATPADYFPKKWGVSAFNMAFNGGGPVDFVNGLNYIIQKSTDKKAPSTLLVELLSPDLGISNPNQTSLEMIPYMSSPMQSLAAFGATADNLVLSSSFSDALFTMLFVDTERWQVWVKFIENGTGIRNTDTITAAGYEKAVKSDVNFMKNLLSCNALDVEGKEHIEKLVSLSHQHQFSIVFYRTPVNADFYTFAGVKPTAYARCQRLLDTYMKTLTQKNPNIFYRNLSAYEKIATMKSTGYTDGHHLYRAASVLVLQALNKEITSALQWAKVNHK